MATTQQETSGAAESPKKSGGMTSIVVLALVGLLSGGAGFATPYFALRFLQPGAGDQQVEQRDSPAANSTLQADVSFVPFGEVIVNLNDNRMSRYLRLNMTVLVDRSQEDVVRERIEQQKLILKDWLLRYLSDQALDDIRGAAGQNRLRREILLQFNTVLSPDGYDRIHDVLFEEFNIQ